MTTSYESDRSRPRKVPSVARAMQLLSLVAQSARPLTLTELSRQLGLAKSTVHGLCMTMLEDGYLRREGSNFRSGPMGVLLAHGFRSSSHVLSEFHRSLDSLPPSPNESVVLSTLVGKNVMCVGARNAHPPLDLLFCEGMQSPAYLAASGKALLAWRDDVVELYRGDPFTRPAGNGPNDLEDLLSELEDVRMRGWSVDDEGIHDGVVSFAAPVFDRRGVPTAAVAIGIAKSLRVRVDGTLQRRVVSLAQQITYRVGGSPAPCLPPFNGLSTWRDGDRSAPHALAPNATPADPPKPSRHVDIHEK